MVVDGAGDLYVGGGVVGALPGQTHYGAGDAFIGKYDAEGNELWMRQFGTRGNEKLARTVFWTDDKIYAAGSASGENPLEGQAAFGGERDAFIRIYDGDGNDLSTLQLGTAGSDDASSLAVDAGGVVYAVGRVEGTLAGQASSGGYDAFLVKVSLEP